jgi:hypothetical protein
MTTGKIIYIYCCKLLKNNAESIIDHFSAKKQFKHLLTENWQTNRCEHLQSLETSFAIQSYRSSIGCRNGSKLRKETRHTTRWH